MIRYLFPIFVLFIILISSSCDKEEFNEELSNNIKGTWDVVFVSEYSSFGGQTLTNRSYHISDSINEDFCIMALHFNDYNFLERESCQGGINYDYRWQIEGNSLKISHFYFHYEAEILKITDNKFHFILEGKYEDQFVSEYRKEEYELER